MEPDLLSMLIQWLFFFAMVSGWLIPAFVFYSVTKQYKIRRPWLFFVAGLVLSITIFQLSFFLFKTISGFVPITESSHNAGVILPFTFAMVINALAIYFFRKEMKSRSQ
jgi:hypothetical protein